MPRKKVVHVEDGEWVTISWNKQREKCCDCGLEHDIDHRVQDGKLQFRATRRERKR
jgi:hypothetical protein